VGKEHTLAQAVEQSPVSIVITDRDGNITYVNRKFTEITGYSFQEAAGQNPRFLKSGQTPSEEYRRMWETISAGQVWRGAFHNRKKNGELYWESVCIAPIRDEDSRITHYLAVKEDITARKRAEDVLAREQQFLEILLENSQDCIYFKDRESRFLGCSKSQSQKYADGQTDLLGKTDFDLFTEEHARPAFEDEQEIMRTGRPLIGKVEKEVTKDGRESWALTSKMPLRNKEGEIVGTFGISKDITAIKQAEAELERTHKQLIQASREAGMAEVAASVLHNIGNVLNSANVSLSVVAGQVKNTKGTIVAKVAALMREHASDLGAFITDDPKGRLLPNLLDQLAEQLAREKAALLSEIDSLAKNIDHIKDIVAMQQNYGKISGVTEKVKVTDLAEDALRMNASALLRHDVRLYREYDEHLPEITVEKHKVLQILVNLIRNAKQACDAADSTVKQLTIGVRNGSDRVRISLKDNGVGIQADNMARLFHFGFTTKQNGHGFGLHSSWLAAKEMGGALTAQSDGPGKGATFVLELPCQPKDTNA
jgi:PAS domain S-box-containing protein